MFRKAYERDRDGKEAYMLWLKADPVDLRF